MIKPWIVLGSGYASGEQAISPLRRVVPWLHHITGEVELPDTLLDVRLLEGKSLLHFRVVVHVERIQEGFATLAFVEPFTAIDVAVLIGSGALIVAVVGTLAPSWLFALIPLWLAAAVLQVRRRLRGMQGVQRELAGFYEP